MLYICSSMQAATQIWCQTGDKFVTLYLGFCSVS